MDHRGDRDAPRPAAESATVRDAPGSPATAIVDTLGPLDPDREPADGRSASDPRLDGLRWVADRTGLAVHHQFPRHLPAGPLGVLAFGPRHLAQGMTAGFETATEHDCERNGCLLASRRLLELNADRGWSWLLSPRNLWTHPAQGVSS